MITDRKRGARAALARGAAAVFAVGAMAAAAPSRADITWDWTLTSTSEICCVRGAPVTGSGSGTFVTTGTTPQAGVPYTVLSVTGSLDGYAITGLASGSGLDNEFEWTSPDGFAVDSNGLGFVFADRPSYFIFDYASAAFSTSFYGQQTAASGFAVYSAQSLTPEVSGAPEPSVWALMMIGVGGLGTALRGRRRRWPAQSGSRALARR